jgi:hypothetical protein
MQGRTHAPEPIIDPAEGTYPEHEAVLADAVGLALQVGCIGSARRNGWPMCARHV